MALPNPYTDGTYDAGSSPASQSQGTLAQLQTLAKTHPEILSDPGILAAMNDPAKLQTALQAWQHSHGMDPNSVYNDQGTLQSGSWFSDHLPVITALMAAGLITPAVFTALAGGGGAAAAGGGALADLGPSTTANIAATGAAGAAPAGIAATGGGAAAGAGGAAAASAPWWQTAIKAGAPLAATALTHGGGSQSPLDPTQQANIQSLLNLSLQRAQETAPVHQAAMALALHLAPNYAKANGLPPSPFGAPPTSATPPTAAPSTSSPTSAAIQALIQGRTGGGGY